MKLLVHFTLLLFLYPMSSSKAQALYDENNVPFFKVPNPLTTFEGEKISTASVWKNKRRPEILQYFTNEVYGAFPAHKPHLSSKILEKDHNALGGMAKRLQIEQTFSRDNKSLTFTILLYLPKEVANAPIFLGYNFFGNHTVTDETEVLVSTAWTNNNALLGITNHTLTEQTRGAKSSRWPLTQIIEAGYGLATIYYGEVDPDKNDFSDGIHALFYQNGQQHPKENEWGSIAAWAWGLHRTMDFLERYEETKNSKVIVFGHSRLGKAALWAGANDERFAAVISNNSGCGGAAMSKRTYGETIATINQRFPHWFCSNFQKYNNNETALEVDQHQLLALIAPRPLYIASAEEDRWADPKGEFLAAYYATPVYELFKKKGIPSLEMPVTNTPILNTLAYHIRSGKHDITEYDWEQYIKWANRFLR
ncbi:glucuronyl esterase domain-containing protein [Arenibacter amylolyticus]|uniref:glucuronyl esterase domain-containing protein n=1 Tax=Arenibacter amylolyticus TaxID=1406873 RepID=UPI000A369C9B|nr:acetylxylan esterase [Arenibacter amylolyticus]